MARTLPLLTLAALLLAAGAASAHANYFTDDDKYQVTVGSIGEPVYTDMKTGLDLVIRLNNTGKTPVEGLEKVLNATLVGPGGQTLNLPLQGQHGKPGYYTFTKGYVLTQPGLYTVRLAGSYDGTDFSGEYANRHEIEPLSAITFPAKDSPSASELAAKVKALETKVAALEHGHETEDAPQKATVPAFEPLLALGLLAAVAAVAFRRRA